MASADPTKCVSEFISHYIDSVETVDVLLLLHNHRDREWSASQVSLELRSNPASAAKRLADLCLRGIFEIRVTPELVYRYAPKTEALAEMVDEFSLVYVKHRVSVIKLIFSKPLDRVSNFAESFRLREKEKEGE